MKESEISGVGGLKICGTGSYVPDNIIENKRFESLVDTSDEWIRTRTGIESRRFADGESNFDMLSAAVRNAMAEASVKAEDVALVIVATITGDFLTPSMACRLQREFGLPENAFVFDVNAACSGFLYALRTASSLLSDMPSGKYAVVAGSEVMSRITDFSDRSTCVLFGDGAGAVVAAASANPFFFQGGAIGGAENLSCKAIFSGVSPFGEIRAEPVFSREYLHMNGPEVFRFAVESAVKSVRAVTADGEGDVYIMHQANERIIKAAAKRLNIPLDKFFVNVTTRGNTSSASIPIALDELNKSGGLRRGDKVVLAAFGAGLTYGAAKFIW